MGLIEWKDSYALGIEEVDHEHRQLITAIDALHQALAGGPDAASPFLGELFALISAHFALEEKMMAAAAWPELDAHKADHERLLDELRDLMDEIEEGSDLDLAGLGPRLDQWFSEHFRTFDARLHQPRASSR